MTLHCVFLRSCERLSRKSPFTYIGPDNNKNWQKLCFCKIIKINKNDCPVDSLSFSFPFKSFLKVRHQKKNHRNKSIS